MAVWPTGCWRSPAPRRAMAGSCSPTTRRCASRTAGSTCGCGSATPQQRTKVRMGMILSIAGTPFFITQDRGYFAAENLDVDFEPVQVTSEAIAQVAAGNLDLAIATVGAAVLNTVSRGIDIRI